MKKCIYVFRERRYRAFFVRKVEAKVRAWTQFVTFYQCLHLTDHYYGISSHSYYVNYFYMQANGGGQNREKGLF